MQLSVNKTWQAPGDRWYGFPALLGTNRSIVRPQSGGIRQDDNELQLLPPAMLRRGEQRTWTVPGGCVLRDGRDGAPGAAEIPVDKPSTWICKRYAVREDLRAKPDLMAVIHQLKP
jgi:hypothetical protein